MRYDWPRNVRELEQTIASAAKLADATIELAHLPDSVRTPALAPALPARERRTLNDSDDDLRAQIIAALAEHDGNIVAVSKALGKRRTTIYKWAKRFAIDLDAFR